MIVSHKHKFVYIKGHKVASTSVEIALSQICGPDDVITPITPIDEKLRSPAGIARNYSSDPAAEKAYAESVAKDPVKKIVNPPETMVVRNHTPLLKVRKAIPGIQDYRLVFSDRSPYEKVLSLANWRGNRRSYGHGNALPTSTEGIAEKVATLIANGALKTVLNIDLYRDEDGRVPVAGWRFETLASDLATFFDELGVTPVSLPHAKQGMGLKADDVQSLLPPEQIAYINDMFAEEFETFGYPRIG